MRKYVEENEIIKKYETTGIIPESYNDYEKDLYNNIFGDKVQNKSLFVTFYQEHNRQGNRAIMTATLPFMWPGWNNKTSCVYQVGITGAFSLYRKTFYRKKIGTFYGWGMNTINLYGSADNSTSSAFKHF